MFPPLPVTIGRSDVLHLLGYRRKGLETPPETEAKLEREIAIARELLRFRGVYLKSPMQVIADEISLPGGFIIPSVKFANWVKDCREIYLFAVTAGPLFSERIEALTARGEIASALMADAAGSAAAEACARTANDYIISLEPKAKLTKRYSPGYGDWKIEENRKLLKLLQADKIGIEINQGGMMLPLKSVSAAIGVMHNAE